MVQSAQATSPLASASYGQEWVVSLLIMAVVAAVGWVVVRSLGRSPDGWRAALGLRARGPRLLEVVARQPLEPRRSLYLVRVAGRALLLGTSEAGLSLLTEVELGASERGAEQELEASAVAPGGRGFGELVRDATRRWQGRRVVAEASAGRAADDRAPEGAGDRMPVGEASAEGSSRERREVT